MLIGTSPRYTLTDRQTGQVETFETREELAAELIANAYPEMLRRLAAQCAIATRDEALHLRTPRKA